MDKIRSFMTLAFADPEQERRYRVASAAWLQPRILPFAVLIAVVFLSFHFFDRMAAPEQLSTLTLVRTGTAGLLTGIGLLAHLRTRWLPTRAAAILLALAVYAGVLLTHLVAGNNPLYKFTSAMMLVQTGVWFLGGMTFVVAAYVNAVAILVFMGLERVVIGVSAVEVAQSVLNLVALSAVAGLASFQTERLIRNNFAAQELLRDKKREFQARALRDGLTGLWNHQAMDELIAAACARGLPGAVFMIDLDGFKPINDRHGHHAGDEALVAVARRVQSVVRPGDAVGRIGGDEFLVLAADPGDDTQAIQLAERLRNRIEAPMRVRPHGDSSTVEVRVGASVGVAAFQGTCLSPDDLLRRADRAMYDDKSRRKQS